MKTIALVGDLHGNRPATDALDLDLNKRQVSEIICLGDIVGKGPSSDYTFDWAMRSCSLVLRGNWDEGIGMRQFPRDEFYYRQLGENRMSRLRELPLEAELFLSGRKIRLFHGRPVMQRLLSIQDDDGLLATFFEPDYQVVCYADAHRQGMRLVRTKGQMVNIGAVGNAFCVPMVQYAILTGDPDDREAPFDITFVNVPYDRAAAVRDVRATPDLVNKALYEYEIRHGVYARKMTEKDAQDILDKEDHECGMCW